MGFTENTNILFKFSGVSGLYVFDQNPETMDILAPKQSHNIINTLLGQNIYQRALLDNNVRVMRWGDTSFAVYSGLRAYSFRTSSGTIPTTYFWDGTVNEFQGTKVQVIDVHGEPINAKPDRWTVELQLKPVNPFDQEYEIN